jgi:hypothetical protein
MQQRLFLSLGFMLLMANCFAKQASEDMTSKEQKQDNHVFLMAAASIFPLELEACAAIYPELKPKINQIWQQNAFTAETVRENLSQCVSHELALQKAECVFLIQSVNEEAVQPQTPLLWEKFKKTVKNGYPMVEPCVLKEEKLIEQLQTERDQLKPVVQKMIDDWDGAAESTATDGLQARLEKQAAQALKKTQPLAVEAKWFPPKYSYPVAHQDSQGNRWQEIWSTYVEPIDDVPEKGMQQISFDRKWVSCEKKLVVDDVHINYDRPILPHNAAWQASYFSREGAGITVEDAYIPIKQRDYQAACGANICQFKPEYKHQQERCRD